jgi:L-2-hydroxyglutarate oxidase LhgO
MDRIGVAVVGGGAVGCAVALELARAGMADVFLFEREARVGEVQSGRNSGVVHAGIYYATGSLKAELCLDANPLLYELCRAHRVPVENVGKLVVAADPGEVPALEAVFAQARANGVPGVRLLTGAEARALEPNVAVTAAMHVPTTGIVDAARYVSTLADLAQEAGAAVLTSFEVTEVEALPRGFRVTGRRGGLEETFECEVLVNAAGLDCDVIGRMVDPTLDLEVVPLRGEYYRVNRRARPDLWLEGLNVYPVPEPMDLGSEQRNMVGAHLTPTFELRRDGSVGIGDTVTVGPHFRIARARADYESDRLPPEPFLARAGSYFPGLRLDDLAVDFAGVMVHLRGASDWSIARDRAHPDCVQLLGIDSPGLTGSLAIARRVRQLLLG